MNQTIEKTIQMLNKRNIEASFYENKNEAVSAFIKSISPKSTISWGGSATIEQAGLLDALKKEDFCLIDRSLAKDAEERHQMYLSAYKADYFLMSANAISQEGHLINMDGIGNRTSAMIYGPKHVAVFAGINKIVANTEEGIKRIRETVAPLNAKRFGKKPVCLTQNSCVDSLSDECICGQMVVTSKSGIPGRIKVYLINEELGF